MAFTQNGTVSRPLAYVTRVESFSACHRLHSAKLSDEENRRIFGKCNNLHGHGHNYKVEVTVKGQVDPIAGMVVNVVDLKQYIKESVMNVMDHRNLDVEVPFFNKSVSSMENVAVYIWESIAPKLERAQLHEVKVQETEKNIVVFRGEYS